MKKLLLVLVLFAPLILSAENVFDGTWRLSSTEFGGKPDVFSLQNGVYRCESCVPKINIKADGTDQKVSGSPYYDTVSARAVDDHTIEIITKKGGKFHRSFKGSASEDGNKLTSEWTFISDNGQKGEGKTTSKRVAPAPEGANKASGSWQAEKMKASENVMTVTYKATADGLSMSDPTGDSYTAKFDGKEYPYKGDPGTTSVSLKKINDYTIEETDFRDGKVIFVTRITVSPDGRSLTMEGEDKLEGHTFKFEGKKQ